MAVHDLCGALKQRVTVELQRAHDPAARGEILIGALYEVSRSVLPELGAPRKQAEYRESQGAVLELITFLVIPLIRGGGHEPRGVTVLAEIAEGCPDPLLRKKLSVYAQQLLAKSKGDNETVSAERWIPWLAGFIGVAVLALYLIWPHGEPPVRHEVPAALPAPQAASGEPAAPKAAPRPPPAAGRPDAAAAGGPQRRDDEPGKTVRPAAEVRGGTAPRSAASQEALAPGEQTTRVRIVNNQVLVPVTLKNGAATVRVELVLDTGATRTAIHERITRRLPIDLRTTKGSEALVADGRVVRSRIAKLDAVAVGPFVVASMEVELFPYHGDDTVHDGLLGMDFLGKHRYQIDMEHELIRWF